MKHGLSRLDVTFLVEGGVFLCRHGGGGGSERRYARSCVFAIPPALPMYRINPPQPSFIMRTGMTVRPYKVWFYIKKELFGILKGNE